MISVENATYQIDHIILSKYGIFVIEMKNYYGLIKREDNQDKWIQYLGKNKYYFKNPIHQNYGHIKSLEKLLNVENKKLIGVVCLSNQAKLKIKTKNLVVALDNLTGLINNFKTEVIDDNSLPKHHCVIKLLRKMNNEENRNAKYKCCVTVMLKDGAYYQEFGESEGTMAKEIIGELTKPYFYSVFILNGTNVAFNNLKGEELNNTYRYIALKKLESKL